MNDRELERIIETAKRNIADGVIEEPRVFFDEIRIPNDGSINFGHADCFKNGEEYPIRIRWMTAAMRYLDESGDTSVDERLVQRVGVRFTFHGQDYMRRNFIRLPVWHDVPVSAGPALNFAQSSWRFDRPFILSSRDSMRVRVKLDVAPATDNNKPFTVGFTGFGLDTRRPYFKAAEALLTDTVEQHLNTDLFRNDGDEPVVVTEMGVHIGAESQAVNPQGNIRFGRVQIQQLGNGTQAEWLQGPVLDVANTGPGPDLCPAVLLGTKSGRAVVHRWPPKVDAPDGGLYWEPGEGIQVEVQGVNSLVASSNAVLAIALVGSIIVS